MDQNSSEQKRSYWSGISLRAKVTLWIVIAFAIVKITLVLIILLYQQRAIHTSFDAAFQERVHIIAEDLAGRDGDINESYLRGIALRETNNLYIQDFSLLLVEAATATPIASYGRESTLLMSAAKQAINNTENIIDYASIMNKENVPFRTAASRIRLYNGVNAVLVVSTSDRYTASVSKTVGRVMLFSTPFTIGVIALVAWFVGGVAVRPLEQVRVFAENLRPESLVKPIDIDGSSSEVDAVREQLDAAMERLDSAYQSQARFLANISHEIKTPISVVQSEADVLMMSKPSNDDYEDFVRSTGEEMQRLGKMVESFLLLTRVQHGDTRVRRKSISANDLVMEAFEQSLTMARQYKVRLEPDLCQDENDPKVIGNEDLLVTAANNLVRNAIRFSPEDEVVSINCKQDNGKLYITVRDRGPGVPEDLLPRLFEPFTQASSERRRGRGTGLGLQIAKGIAELHGGDIQVKNHEKGCGFTLILPLSKPPETV